LTFFRGGVEFTSMLVTIGMKGEVIKYWSIFCCGGRGVLVCERD
jgi:hypothetical protein